MVGQTVCEPGQTCEATAQAFANDDWAEVTLHSYQHRWGHAPGDSRYDAEEKLLEQTPQLSVPKVLPGIGHFPQRENPGQIVAELTRFLEC